MSGGAWACLLVALQSAAGAAQAAPPLVRAHTRRVGDVLGQLVAPLLLGALAPAADVENGWVGRRDVGWAGQPGARRLGLAAAGVAAAAEAKGRCEPMMYSSRSPDLAAEVLWARRGERTCWWAQPPPSAPLAAHKQGVLNGARVVLNGLQALGAAGPGGAHQQQEERELHSAKLPFTWSGASLCVSEGRAGQNWAICSGFQGGALRRVRVPPPGWRVRHHIRRFKPLHPTHPPCSSAATSRANQDYTAAEAGMK